MRGEDDGGVQVVERRKAARDPEGRFLSGSARPVVVRRPLPVGAPVEEPAKAERTLATAAIGVAMTVVTAVMAAGVPAAVLYVTFGVIEAEPSLAVGLLVLAAFVAGVVACMKLLVILQRLQCRLASIKSSHAPHGWNKARCDDRERRPASLLDTVVTWATLVAIAALAVWFFGFATWTWPGA